MGTFRNNPTSAQIEERRRHVAMYLKLRYAIREIVTALTKLDPPIVVTKSTVDRDKQEIIRRWREETVLDIEAQMTVDLSLIHDLVRAQYQNAVSGDVAAAQTVVKLLDRKAKMLGYDAPYRQELKHSGDGLLSLNDFVLATVKSGALPAPPEDLDAEPT